MQIESGPHCSFAMQQTWAPSSMARLLLQAYQLEAALIWLLERRKQLYVATAVEAGSAILGSIWAMVWIMLCRECVWCYV
jgi:hypothetical protein